MLCDVVDESTHELVPMAPRSVLRRQVDRLAEHGLVARAASELEFYLYDDTYREAHDSGYTDLVIAVAGTSTTTTSSRPAASSRTSAPPDAP
ncbi:MAG: hypothetical protein R2697_21715 [Ilumatobacteraceae bacterium]